LAGAGTVGGVDVFVDPVVPRGVGCRVDSVDREEGFAFGAAFVVLFSSLPSQVATPPWPEHAPRCVFALL
jgi:hypothetical protein